MSQPRMNLYGFSHKGLRNALSQLSLLSGNTDYGDAKALEKLKALNKEIVILLDIHNQAEDNVVLAALEVRAPGSTVENVEEHVQLEREVEAFDKQINAFAANSVPGFGAAYYDAVNSFQSKYLAHMAMEENEINSIIWENFTDEELMAQQGQIMASFTPEQTLMWLKYIVPAQNPFERSILLGGLKANAPAEFFQKAMGTLKSRITETEYLQLEAMLG